MSTFVDIVRYRGDPDAGDIHRLETDELTQLLAADQRYQVSNHAGTWVVDFPCAGTMLSATLEGGILSHQLQPAINTDEVVNALSSLADRIPGAVVQDEEGTTY